MRALRQLGYYGAVSFEARWQGVDAREPTLRKMFVLRKTGPESFGHPLGCLAMFNPSSITSTIVVQMEKQIGYSS